MKVDRIYIQNRDCIKTKENEASDCDVVINDVIHTSGVWMNTPDKGDKNDLVVRGTLWCKEVKIEE
jgi:hypothetical protein